MESQRDNSEPRAGTNLNTVPLGISTPLRRILTGAALFLLVCAVAVAGYMAAGWRMDDAVYMVIITIFGVGYGEVQPIESPPLRALTITVIIAGYGAVIYTIGGFMRMLIDGELNRALGARRMTKGIERLSGHTIICGVGRLGNPRTEKKLLGCGAEKVVLPTAIGAQKVAQLITRPTAEHILQQIQEQSTMLDDFSRIGLQVNELVVSADSDLANQAISEIEIVMFKRNGVSPRCYGVTRSGRRCQRPSCHGRH